MIKGISADGSKRVTDGSSFCYVSTKTNDIVHRTNTDDNAILLWRTGSKHGAEINVQKNIMRTNSDAFGKNNVQEHCKIEKAKKNETV